MPERMALARALLIQAGTDYPNLDAADRYVIVESQHPELFASASVELSVDLRADYVSALRAKRW